MCTEKTKKQPLVGSYAMVGNLFTGYEQAHSPLFGYDNGEICVVKMFSTRKSGKIIVANCCCFQGRMPCFALRLGIYP